MAIPLIYFVPAAAFAAGSAMYKGTKKLFNAYADRKKKRAKDLKKDTPDFTTAEGRQKHLETIKDNLDDYLSILKAPSEQEVNRNLVILFISTGLAVWGFFASAPVLGLLSIPGLLYTSWPIHKCTYDLLKSKRLGVVTLSTLAILGCIVYKFYVAASVMILTYQLSRKFLLKVTEDTRGKIIDIFNQFPDFVWIEVDGAEVRIERDKIKTGDIIIINAGEVVGVDGIIVKGIASIDQHILTGEYAPSDKGTGEQVYALTKVLSGKITVKAENVGGDTTAAKIGTALNKITDYQTISELRAKLLAEKTVIPVLCLSGLATFLSGPQFGVAVVKVHFKYRFALAIPISILNFFDIASKHGILIKDGRSLDLLPKVDTIVFDKSGTLTTIQPSVGRIYSRYNYSENKVLIYAAAAESEQTHPIARTIIQEALKRDLKIPDLDQAEYKIGFGLTVKIKNTTVLVGSQRFIEMSGLSLPEDIEKIQNKCHFKGHSLVIVAANKRIIGAIELIPTIRPEAKETIRTLRTKQKIKNIYVISGDHQTPTRVLAEQLGIENFFAGISPEEKADIIDKLCREGKFVCYVGDGINDVLAMKYANISVSLTGAAAVATDTAQIILLNEGLSRLPLAFRIAKGFNRNNNLIISAVAVPTLIGLGGIFFFGLGLLGSVVLSIAGIMTAVITAMVPKLFDYSKEDPLLLTDNASN